MKELVELIAKALVDNPEKVLVSQLEGEQTTILELKVAPEDLGKVIGKQGRTARAIRIILGAAGMKLKRRFNLEIIEKYLSRGSEVAVEGKLTHRNYDDKEGNKRYYTEIVLNDMVMLRGRNGDKEKEE